MRVPTVPSTRWMVTLLVVGILGYCLWSRRREAQAAGEAQEEQDYRDTGIDLMAE